MMMNSFSLFRKNRILFRHKLSHKYFSNTPSTKGPLISFDLISNNKDIGLLTIKNSAKRNALSYEILTGLINEFEKIEKSFKEKNLPRVVILNAEGSVFSSGHDLKELSSASEELKVKIFDACSLAMIKIQQSSSIVIAEVNGLATAAGCQLAASCDLIVASSKAKFETPGVRIGLFCSSPSVALARAISPKRAMQMLVTGEQISAQKAQDWGLVNEVIDVENLDEHMREEKLRAASLKLAEHINQYSGQALSFGKRTFYSHAGHTTLEGAYEIAGKAMCSNLSFSDTKEGISAFIQKRKPTFNKV